MTETDLLQRFSVAQSIARDAGHTALNYFRHLEQLTIERKGLQDSVSEADRQVEQLIREKISACFPSDAILGEEYGADADLQNTAAPLWVVDPIDGTECFVQGLPTWCISIALLVEGGAVLGVVYAPLTDELYAARRAHGAALNGCPLQVSAATDLSQGSLGVGFSQRVQLQPVLDILAKVFDAGGMVFRNGSGALSLAYVAAGRYIGYYDPHLYAWDALAGILLVQEAGGWSSDFLSGDYLTRGSKILVCAPGITAQLRAICE